MTNASMKCLVVMGLFLCLLATPTVAMAQDADTSWKEGFKAYEARNWQEAERLFRRALQEGGEAYQRWGWLHMVLGTTLYQRGQHSEAISELQTAKELVTEDQERFQVNHALGQVYVGRGDSGDYDRAIAAENEAGQYAGNGQQRALVAKTLGQSYYYKENWDRARQQLETASQQRTSDAQVFAFLGRAYFELGQSQPALEAFQKAVQLDRTNKQALVLAARISYDNRDFTEAVQYAERAIQAYPQDANVRNQLGRGYLGAKRYDEAIQQLEQVVQIGGTGSRGAAYYNLGQAYQAVANDGKAIASYLSALENLGQGTATRAECFYDLGFVYEKVNQYEDALSAYEDSAGISEAGKVTEAINRVKERIRRANASS